MATTVTPVPSSTPRVVTTAAPEATAKASKPPAASVKTPAATPLPMPPVTGIFDSLWGAAKSTLQATRQIANSAFEQAKTDRENGKGIVNGMQDFSTTVNDLLKLLGSHAQTMGYSKSQQQNLTLDQAGAIAQNYATLSVKDLLAEGAAGISGSSNASTGGAGILELVLSNLGAAPVAAGQGAPSQQTTGGRVTAPSAGTALTGGPLSAQIMGAVGAAHGAWQVFANWGRTDPVSGAINGFTAGAYLGGSVFGAPGAAIGGVIGGLVGLASGLARRSGKPAEQLARDQVRAALQSNGILTKNWELTLADGTHYDIGKDGNHKLVSADGSSRKAFDIDLSNPLTAEAIALVQPLGLLVSGGNPNLAREFTGYFANAVISNAKTPEEARLNAVALLKSMKVDPKQIAEGIATLVKQGTLSEETGKAYLTGLARLIDADKPAKTSSSGTKKAA